MTPLRQPTRSMHRPRKNRCMTLCQGIGSGAARSAVRNISMKFLTRTILAAAIVLWPSVALAQISGPTRVIDGDTIDVSGTRIRLYGIDAPEKQQTCEGSEGQIYECGRDASAVMAELTVGHTVDCEPQAGDRYGRTVAICSNESGDIGAAMVRRGWAVPYMRYGGSRYLNEQSEAQ